MKKIIALLLCVVSIFVLSVSVSAASSPVADKVFSVITIVPEASGNISESVKPATVKVNDGGTITVTAPATVKNDSAAPEFKGFKVYKQVSTTNADGTVTNSLVEAVLGVDYQIVKGTLGDKNVEIKPLADVVVVANYKDLAIDPSTGNVTVQPESPATGSATAICFAIVALAAAAVIFGAKKQTVR